ncbi:TonB-dependent receptor [Urechidicola croceus]|uniref:TonB-dependent receptor n=1 Tax=Urechidicola croceus TaxID=1850246 RepID=A0A1D8P5H7_9FLAO|nr:TonB-dependent receptor plug domain-containing protein [Urechidicola croceus]AOW19824.1 TonB-dependent receptor [Urechidicola croceus]
MKTILLMLFLSICTFSQAQTSIINGKIKDSFNQPIENAYVYNSNSNNHTHTLENGVFILKNNSIGDTLTIGILGFQERKITLKNEDLETNLSITLESKVFNLQELVLTNEFNPNATITKLDLESNPVNSSQEILRKVPGLVIGQHAGGGKAEQLFLRGFDIDHGTDISISVDGMPVNMVSHAHGQGYSDLHFVIPETIKNINFGKGPYNATKGDFNTAGFVDFSTKDNIDNNKISIGIGDFNSIRTLGLFNLSDKKDNQNMYTAIEYIENDGPFISPQNFSRLNIMTKYSTLLNDTDKLSLTASHFTSNWTASGQIPTRVIDSISRFGSIDDTEGGNTSRTNFNIAHSHTINDNERLKTNVFYTHYDFELYSNFTFFLDDPINGDQIKQKEDRNIFGFNTQLVKNKDYNTIYATYTSGLGLRHDISNKNELSHTLNRKTTLDYLKYGNIYQTNLYGFYSAEFEIGKFKINPAIRFDYFKFMYENKLSSEYNLESKTKNIFSPKLNISFSQNKNSLWFLKSGIGFHSNDTRVVVSKNGKDILPKAYGVDFGNIWKPTSKLVLNTAFWYLLSEQEFVYVGDAGIVEPSGKSQRFGLDLGIRYQFNDYLYFDTDATLTNAKNLDLPSRENYIPLAPDFTVSGGLSLNNYKSFSGGIRYRYIDDRPANEDNSINAQGYLITDFNLNYTFGKTTIGIAIENLFDIEWNETQFATESRLSYESQPVEEIHFTPGTPFYFKTSINYAF